MTADRPDTAPDVALSEDEWETLTDACCGAWCNTSRGLHARIMRQVQPAVETILRTRLAAVEAAHARDHAALRERAEVAEAKVAAVEAQFVALADELWQEGKRASGYPLRDALKGASSRIHDALRAALADRPAGGEATTRAPSIGTEPYRGKG